MLLMYKVSIQHYKIWCNQLEQITKPSKNFEVIIVQSISNVVYFVTHPNECLSMHTYECTDVHHATSGIKQLIAVFINVSNLKYSSILARHISP